VERNLAFYRRLSQLSWPKSYAGKILLIAFCGVQIPLLVILLYIAISTGEWRQSAPLLLIGLLATLSGTLLTLLLQAQLLAPVLETAQALADYTQHRKIPKLPTTYTDEAGMLMASAQLCIAHNERLLKLKNNFLAILSHDIRSPISDIVLLSEIMEEELDAGSMDVERLKQQLAHIRSAAHSQLDLMNSILKVARAEAGKVEVHRTEARISDLLAQVSANAQLQAERNGVKLSTKVEGAKDAVVQLDVPKTLQVLNNLVQNALRFTAAGGCVDVAAVIQPCEILFTVKDTGIGMEPEATSKIFEPFTSLRSYGTTEEVSSGLGLWICKTFIEVQGGQITVESQPGRGSSFYITLPQAVN
jgi:signal transduction histidine kinase